jgi:hypothetical protein
MEEMRNAKKILVGKPERKRPRGRTKSRWKYDVLVEVGWKGLDWMHLA